MPKLRITAGYLYSTFNPYTYYDTPPPPAAGHGLLHAARRDHARRLDDVGSLPGSVYGRRNLSTNQFVSVGAEGAYEDECYIFDVKFFRRYTSVNNDSGSTTVLFQITLKTVGQFGFHAL